MALSAAQCAAFNNYLSRRTPSFDKEFAKDRFPYSFIYSNMYEQKPFPAFTGTEHTWDKIHVTRPNDDGCWETVDITNCIGAPCSTSRKYTGWGATRATYGLYKTEYQTPVFCFDQLRHVEEARTQLAAIVQGHKQMPDEITSDFIRMMAVRSSDVIHICGSALTTVTTTAVMFTNNCKRIDLGGAGNLPTSKLSMEYLDNHVEELMLKGYHDRSWTPDAKFMVTSDLTTMRELTNKNPALTQMYTSADFAKGGKYYAFGAMAAAGSWLFKPDATPLRFRHINSGVLERIWPYENVSATIGKKPEFSTDYKNAEYQMYHVYNRAAREVHVGDITPVNPEMQFGLSRSMLGKWSWKHPDYFTSRDPNTGTVCTFQNDKDNMGYFLGEWELGVKTVYPEIEMIIIAKREPVPVANIAKCASEPTWSGYQDLAPYNDWCET